MRGYAVIEYILIVVGLLAIMLPLYTTLCQESELSSAITLIRASKSGKVLSVGVSVDDSQKKLIFNVKAVGNVEELEKEIRNTLKILDFDESTPEIESRFFRGYVYETVVEEVG